MFIRKYWIPLTVFLLAIVGVGLYYLKTRPPKNPIVIYKATPVEVEKPTAEAPTPKPPPPGESAESGHWHGDEWHPGPHEAHETPAVPKVQNTAPPGAVTTPDFPAVDPNDDPVEAAYKRLEYIKNNPYAWGGVHSERATELIAQLMPPPEAIDHGQGEEVLAEMYELTQQGDPRAAEVFAGLLSPTYEGFTADSDVLVEIGPPAVPYILPYLEREDTMGSDWIVVKGGVFDSLSRIGERYRDDLGGILDHIIIPKFEVIAADENNERYHKVSVISAREALSRLGQ